MYKGSRQKIDYKYEAQRFIDIAFGLLDEYKYHPEHFRQNSRVVDLLEPFQLRLSQNGYFAILDKSKPTDMQLRAHGYNKKYSQITIIGKLLTSYLELIQTELDNHE